MIRPGALLGVGRTAKVFELGSRSVVKVLRPGIPAEWADLEARLTAAVHARGLPTPAVRDLIEIEGRAGVVFERIDGPSMWTQMLRSRSEALELARLLASLHVELHAQPAPDALPSLIDRVVEKVGDADGLTDAERNDAKHAAARLDAGTDLCHGDLHPGNVIMGSRGPVVIDWYDAAAGQRIGDVVRSSLLIRPPTEASNVPPHLPGATIQLLRALHARYLEVVLADRPVSAGQIRAWESVLAASRLAERAERNDAALIALWRNRRAERSSVLLRELQSLPGLSENATE